MIKRSIFFIGIALSLITTSYVLAQEPATSPASQKTATTSSDLVDDDKVKSLKDKLATKVAELRENQTKGFYGEIAALSKTSFTLGNLTSELKVRYTEDVTIYKIDAAYKKTEAAIKDLKNTISVSVLGVYEEENKQQSAKIVLIQTLPTFYSGEVTKIDKTNGTIQIKSGSKELTVDYERATLANEFDKAERKLKKSGLSRFAPGDHIQVWGTPSDDDATKIKGIRLIRLPKILYEVGTAVEGATTSSPSPIASASASPKSSPKASPASTPKASPQE